MEYAGRVCRLHHRAKREVGQSHSRGWHRAAVRDCAVARKASAMGTLLLVLDLVGTFVFALSGATAGVKYPLDLFGGLGLLVSAGQNRGIARGPPFAARPPAGVPRSAPPP